MEFSEPGCAYHAVLDAIKPIDETMWLAFDVAQSTEVLVCDVKFLTAGRHVAYHLKILDLSGPVMLTGTEATWVTKVPGNGALPRGIVELCVGTGAMGVAATFLGAKILVSMDNNDLSIKHLTANQHGIVLKGDVTCIDDILRVHQHVQDESFFLFSGFPCQPYSTQGMQLHGADPRAEVFRGLVRAIMLLQPSAVILECVVGASQDHEVRLALRQLCERLGWQMKDAILELAHQWPTRRRRWWMILAPASWNLSAFKTWPRTSRFDGIGKVLPSMGEFSLYEEENLTLTPEELRAYSNPRYGKEDRLLHRNRLCPTLLHSYASALTECPCKCRSTGFSEHSLESKGLRGVFILSSIWNMPRFLHPLEMAILQTLPITVKFEGPPRHSLPLLGQIAAPLQALWTFVHLLNSTAGIFSQPLLAPMDVMDKYRETLLGQLRSSFPFAVPQVPITVSIRAPDGAELSLLASGHSTVADLIHAEQISLSFGETLQGAIDGHLVPQHQVLPQRALLELRHHERRDRHQQTGQIALAICHGEELLVEFGTPGIFVFQLLNTLELDAVRYVVNDAGRILGRDARIWTSQRVITLGPLTFPNLGVNLPGDHIFSMPITAQVTANGFSGGAMGLDDVSMWKACQQIVACLNIDDQFPLLVPPLLGLRLLNGEDALTFRGLRLPLDLLGNKVIVPLILDRHWTLLWGTRIGILGSSCTFGFDS